jgi:hypothetical protein
MNLQKHQSKELYPYAFPFRKLIPVYILMMVVMLSCSKTNNQEDEQPIETCGPDSMYYTITPFSAATKFTYEYDDLGRLITMKSYHGPILNYSYHYTFNSVGNVISWIERNQSGALLRDRKATYDAQGRMSGYTQEGFGFASFAEKTAKFGYNSNVFSTANMEGADTIYHAIHFYQNDDLTRSEHYLYGQLMAIDMIQYTNTIVSPLLEKTVEILMNKSLPSKHYPSRKITYDVQNQQRDVDDNYIYQFDTEDRLTRLTLKSNITRFTPPEDRTYSYWYNCK